MLIDIATEELSHLQVIGTIVAMLNKGAKGHLSEGMEEEAEMSGDVPWTAAYVDTIGDPTCDLRSNIAAEARAKIIYERLVNCTDDPGVREALGFLMTREIAHQQQFEKALYSMQSNFPPGKQAGMPEFTNVYFSMFSGDGDARGPWNNEPTFEYREAQVAVEGGSGVPQVKLESEEAELVEQAVQRLQSDPASAPTTGAMLGMDGNAMAAGAGDGDGSGTLGDPQAAKELAQAKAATKGGKKTERSSSGSARKSR